ncbi:MAG: RDD family protein [Xanthobacteraceae bacterium]
MSDYGQSYGASRPRAPFDVKPHAYDPYTRPELFASVLPRRVFAFVIDVVLIAVPLILAWIFIFIFGLVTFGFGWALFWLLSPASVIWALIYYGITLGSSASASIGMRAMGLEMRTWYGAPAYFVLGAVSAVVFWVTVTMLTPFVLIVGLFNSRHRLLHNYLVGTVIINKLPPPYPYR